MEEAFNGQKLNCVKPGLSNISDGQSETELINHKNTTRNVSELRITPVTIEP